MTLYCTPYIRPCFQLYYILIICKVEENKVTPIRGDLRTVGPETTAKIARNNRRVLRDLKKSRRKVELAGEEDNASVPSDSEDEEDKLDNKASRNQKHQRQ